VEPWVYFDVWREVECVRDWSCLFENQKRSDFNVVESFAWSPCAKVLCEQEPGWVHILEECRAQGDKFSPRATKQYFVGHEGYRIYLM
jgi:hypothetical protein